MYLVVNIGVDTAENAPFKIGDEERKLGFAGAAVVTTCAGLKLLLRTAYRAMSADAAGLLEAVCPSKGSGKYWAEISTTTDEPTPESDVPAEIKNRGWEWRQGGFFYGQPPWIPVHKSSCLGEEAAIDPIGIENSNSTCGWSAANAHGVCGNETRFCSLPACRGFVVLWWIRGDMQSYWIR